MWRQTFSQLNLLENNYTHRLLSYFESEGDNTQTLSLLPTEDGLWQQIKLNPQKLPQGKFQIIPGLAYARLKHLPLAGKQATGIIQKKQNITTYELLYNSISRKLIITFQTGFPHKILGWEETYESGFGPSKKELTTTATIINSLQLPYWNHNQLSDSTFRKTLFTKP